MKFNILKVVRGTGSEPRTLDLALQGGGAHGAFTWGVLDRLLADERIAIGAVSGASAGAMNAVVLASGLASGGPEAAAAALRGFWKSVNAAAVQSNPALRVAEAFPLLFAGSARWWTAMNGNEIGRSLPPELGRNAQATLADALRENVDFDALRSPATPKVFVSATNARTGGVRIFRNAEISVEAVLASACLPTLFPPVTIDGDDYWDGGYSANPPLLPMIQETDTDDLLLVTINPILRDGEIRTAAEIGERLVELTFNQSLLNDLRSIMVLKEALVGQSTRGAGALARAVRDLRVHEIHDEPALAKIDPRSKLIPEWRLLVRLHGMGWKAADTWLGDHLDDVGSRTSADLVARYS